MHGLKHNQIQFVGISLAFSALKLHLLKQCFPALRDSLFSLNSATVKHSSTNTYVGTGKHFKIKSDSRFPVCPLKDEDVRGTMPDRIKSKCHGYLFAHSTQFHFSWKDLNPLLFFGALTSSLTVNWRAVDDVKVISAFFVSVLEAKMQHF